MVCSWNNESNDKLILNSYKLIVTIIIYLLLIWQRVEQVNKCNYGDKKTTCLFWQNWIVSKFLRKPLVDRSLCVGCENIHARTTGVNWRQGSCNASQRKEVRCVAWVLSQLNECKARFIVHKISIQMQNLK